MARTSGTLMETDTLITCLFGAHRYLAMVIPRSMQPSRTSSCRPELPSLAHLIDGNLNWRRRCSVTSLQRSGCDSTNSGMEATLLCLRLAMVFTGRPRVAKFEGHYHGAHNQVLVSYAPPSDLAGPPDAPEPVPDSRGISQSVLEATMVLPWNDWSLHRP